MTNEAENFDFRLSVSAMEGFINACEMTQNILEEARESQLEIIAEMTANWQGSAADTLRAEAAYFFDEGQYKLAYDRNAMFCNCLEEYMPHINKLRARCAGFVDQLHSNAYVEPIPADAYRCGDILSIDYGQVARIKEICDEITKENETLTTQMADTIRECRGLISGTDEHLERLYAASRKVNRIANYKDSPELYERGMRALEADMNADMAAIEAMCRSDEGTALSEKPWNNSEDLSFISDLEVSMVDLLKNAPEDWTEEAKKSACMALENWVINEKSSFLEEVAQILTLERYEEKTYGGRNSVYFMTELDRTKWKVLLQSSVDMHLAGATQYLHLLDGVHTEPLPIKKRGSGKVTFNFRKKAGSKSRLITRLETDCTVAQCETEAGPLKAIGVTESKSEEYTEWDRYLDLGLTGYVKYGYHELVAALPDGLMLLYGNTKETIYGGSVLQALHNDGNLDNVNQNVITNTRTHVDSYIDSFWDNSLGNLELLGEVLIYGYDQYKAQPIKYGQDVMAGKSEDNLLEQGVKMHFGAIQTVTGYPAYTAACNMEKTFKDLGGQLINLADRVPKTSEDWREVAQNTKSNIESKITEVKTTAKKITSMTPQDWGNAWKEGMTTLGQKIDAKIDYLFSKEGMEEVYTVTGNIQGTLDGSAFAEAVEGAVGIKVLDFKGLKLLKGKNVVSGKGAKEAVEAGIEVVEEGTEAALKGGLKTVDTGDLKVIETKTAELANKEWLANGYDKPPYHPDFEVKVVEAGNEEYVRVFSYNADGTSNKLGGWLMKKSDIEGLTPAQIADKYALPKEPTHICDVNLSQDFNLQTGIANSVEGWGKGGGQQFDTMGKFIDEDAFVNERLIGE